MALRPARAGLALIAGIAAAVLVCFAGRVLGLLSGRMANWGATAPEENYQRVRRSRRDEALSTGCSAPIKARFFWGPTRPPILRTAASAVTEALALAGTECARPMPRLASPLLPDRKTEIDADCYALLLVLADIRGRQSQAGQGEKEAYQEPLRILERARRLGFETRAYHLRRTFFLEAQGNEEEAARDRAQAASVSPGASALDHFLLGEEQYRRGDWVDAKNSFNRTLGLQPSHFWARFFLGVCHLKTGHWEAAKAGLGACLGQHPDFVWGYLFRSFANEKLRALPEAEADFQNALRLNPNQDARYVLFLTRGILHFNQQEWERAAHDFRSAMILRPKQYNAYLNLAQVYLAQGKFDEAEATAGAASHGPGPAGAGASWATMWSAAATSSARPPTYLGSAWRRVRRRRACIWIRSSRRHLRKFRARASLLAAGALPGGRSQCVRPLPGKCVENHAADIFRGRGLAADEAGQISGGRGGLHPGRWRRTRDDGDLYEHRGLGAFLLRVRGSFGAARFLEKPARYWTPEAGDAYTGRGLAHVMLGNHRDAVADAGEALRRRPGTPEMMHNVACIFAQAAARAATDAEAERPPGPGGRLPRPRPGNITEDPADAASGRAGAFLARQDFSRSGAGAASRRRALSKADLVGPASRATAELAKNFTHTHHVPRKIS